MKLIAIAGAINGFFFPRAAAPRGERSVRFFHFSGKKRKRRRRRRRPEFHFVSSGQIESGDSLRVKEFHCKRDHPNSVESSASSAGCLKWRVARRPTLPL